MAKFKHFTLEQRVSLETMLNSSLTFKAIAKELEKDCTTISKEIRNHILFKRTGAFTRAFNNCIHRSTCNRTELCSIISCKIKYCRFCSKCNIHCSDYVQYFCPSLSKPPYICNGCSNLKSCCLQKSIYSAAYAHKEYVALRSESRSGITITEDEIQRLDTIISPLIQKGQSIHHICANNRDLIMHSEKSMYTYINLSLFSVKNIDLPRKVVFRPRKMPINHFKVDRQCRVGRTYEDFLEYMKEHPDTPIVEMDSVIGTKGGKVLLTIHFTNSQFMLAFIRNSNTSRSVIDIFENLYWELGPETFIRLFPVILTDNGSEFSNPKAIEFDKQGNRITRIFYCNPSAPYQKGAAENNHTLIRRIVPKGQSFNAYDQNDITLMMNHINSYGRRKLNDQSPHSVFNFLHGSKTLEKLGSNFIHPNEIIMNPSLVKK